MNKQADWSRRVVSTAFVLVLAACAQPPTDVVDMTNVPELTRDAMVQVRVLPLGVSLPMYAGSVGPVSGFGCAANPADATADAIQQLKIKALQMRATAVIDVAISSAGGTACNYGYGAHAAGIAVAARGVPSTF
jgi:hypothetical protein